MTDRTPHTEEAIPPEDFALFLAMREKIKQGARIRFLKDSHSGELVAVEEVLHRASDFKESKAA